MSIYRVDKRSPNFHATTYLAPSADIIGEVTLGEKSSVWFQCVLRGDTEPITIGAESNFQDLSMGHADPGKPLIIGNRVTVGHRCIMHGCVIEDDCLIGMGAIIMNEAHIGRGSIVGAGAVVLEGTRIPPFSLVVGNPGKVKKTYDETIIELIRKSAAVYVERGASYRQSFQPVL